MKQKIRVKGPDGKTTTGTIKIRDLTHFETQLKTKAKVFKPKKGKGSFKRKPKNRREKF